MRAVEWLCYAGTEISNSARTTYYARNLGSIPGLTLGADCPCPAIDEGYVSISADPAPWYEPTRPESEDFYGFYAYGIEVPPVIGRVNSPTVRHGSVLSPMRFAGRQIQVSGAILASSMEGMAYGERWLAAALRGSYCAERDCPQDDALILPACPDDPYLYDAAFRTLVDVGTVDGPVFTQIADLPECYIQEASFLLISSQPWLYHPTERCLDAEPVPDSAYASPASCALTTPEWMGEGVFVIDITAQSDVTNLVITGRLSLDGDCPVGAPGNSVMPSFTYTIPELLMDDRIVIDAMRRHAYHYDASSKLPKSALPKIDFTGPFLWPEVGPCSTMCVTFELDTGDATVTVDTALREI